MIRKLSILKVLILLLHAFVIWALCGLVMFVGPKLFTMETSLIIHALGAPVFAGLVSLVYYRKFNYTKPFQTAFIVLLFVVIMDAGLVAPVFEKSFEMFTSFLGTWLPFTLIFCSTLVTGLIAISKK